MGKSIQSKVIIQNYFFFLNINTKNNLTITKMKNKIKIHLKKVHTRKCHLNFSFFDFSNTYLFNLIKKKKQRWEEFQNFTENYK